MEDVNYPHTNINLSIYKKRDSEYNDDVILKFLKDFGPAPPHLISLATGIPVYRVSLRLKQLEKYKKVKRAYRRLVPFYKLIGGEEDGRKRD